MARVLAFNKLAESIQTFGLVFVLLIDGKKDNGWLEPFLFSPIPVLGFQTNLSVEYGLIA